MIRRVLLGGAVIATMLAAGTAITARAADTKRPPDLTGQWRLDAKHSDMPGRDGAGMRGGRGGGGNWGGRFSKNAASPSANSGPSAIRASSFSSSSRW